MSTFHFAFEILLNQRLRRRDLVRQLLARIRAEKRRVQSEHDRLQQRRNNVLSELRDLGSGGQVDVDRAASRRYFAGQLQGEIGLVERELRLIQQQYDQCKQTLVEADRDVKILEKLKERQRLKFESTRQRQLQFELEDTWLAGRTGRSAA